MVTSPGGRHTPKVCGGRSTTGRDQVVSVPEGGIDVLASLLLCTGDGDVAAFSALYDRTSARVYGMARRVLCDPGFAEETTQEVYLQVWRTASTFDPAKGSAVSWLMMLTHRRAVDRVRSEQAHTEREIAFEIRNQHPKFDQVSEAVIDCLEQRTVHHCLDTLTPTQLESVVLAYYGGYTYRQVAAHLGVAVPTIKSRIRDGLIRLRGCVGTPYNQQ